ncbi:P-loop containing nucleoside triphosphate hydrolase protein [Lactarius hengduanensis]|nr:P-loop containing nucleoside triphosphate hydrolase protein [Lactarius hengduanensis]
MSADSSTSKNGPINVKLLMLGHGSVGKSSLLLRFTDQQWLPELEATATIGVDTWSHKLDVKGRRVNLTVWDTPGVERFRALTSSYYRGTQGILLVYDITDRESYDALAWWFAERSKHVPESTVKIIIGNKADKEHARQVPTGEAAAYAGRMGCLFVEASAKTAIGVCAAFRGVVERIVDTPELWAGQESRIVSPLKVTSPTREPQVDEDQSGESSEWVQIIGSISFGRCFTIRFGGPP